MALIDGFKNISSLFSSQKQANPGIFGFFTNTAMPRMGEKEFLKAHRGWVFACTNAIAQRIADIDLILQKKDKDGNWQDYKKPSEAMDLLHNVNNFMSYHALAYGYAAYQELDGNSFWYLVKNASGKITEIWPLNPTQIQSVKSKKDFISGYVFTSEIGDKVPLAPDEVLHFKRFHPTNPYRGMGTVEAAAIAIDTDTYAAEWQRNFFGNSAMPAAILTSEGTLNQDQYDRIKANWEAKYKGFQNAHKMAILEGNLKYQAISPTARDMQFTEGRKDLRDEICGIFGVPLPVLGILDTANLASADAADTLFAKNTVKPKMKEYVGNLTEFYLPLFGMSQSEYRIWFTDPVPENREQKRLDRESGIKNYYMTPNEARAEIGLEPVEGGEFLYVPSLYIPIAKDDAEPDPAGGGGGESEGKGFHRLPVKSKVASKKKSKVASSRDPQYIADQIAGLNQTFLDLNDKLKSMLLANLKNEKALKEGRKKTLIQRLKDATDPSSETNRILFDNYSDWIQLVYDASFETMKSIYAKGGVVALAGLNISADTFDLENPRAVDWLEAHALDASTSYSDTMKEAISQTVSDAFDEGASNADIADSVSGFFDEESAWRADRIARTETITAYSQGNLEAYRQSGVVGGKYWIADANACEICEENVSDGIIGLDESFSSGDDSPTAHPNCECDLGASIDGEEE